MNQTEKAYLYIRERILEGHYQPAEKLVESQLADVIGVSRNTIKKALLELEKEQLVEIEINKGAKIKSFSMDEVINYLEIREVVEGLIIRSSAERISNDDLRKLHEILNKMEREIRERELEKHPKLNQEFHNIINKASKNTQAVKLVTTIKTQLIRHSFKIILVPGRDKDTIIEHKQIYEALEKHNPDDAEKAIKKHIQSVRNIIFKYFNYLR
ncbi:MAG: transcriptional regulator [Peptococcaceae bacterium BICA1-8]|nr:MAG: transcriptional regulator [Peptococcaceae bacterium BICA1-8]